MPPWILLTALAVAALVVAEWKTSAVGIRIAKPLASLGFILTATACGAQSNPYGRLMLAAFALCWLGDVLLIPESKRAFLAGLGSFLLGHATFAVAFVRRGADERWALAAIAVLIPLAAVVWRWLAPHVPEPMRGPVAAYIVAILAMASAAAGTTGAQGDWRILAGAVAFFVSDLSVARDHFVRRDLVNRVWGLPLYYAAQLLLASSV